MAPATEAAEVEGLTPAGLPTPGAPEKAAVRSMFDRIAPRYDLLNRLLSAGTDVRWRRAAVDLLDAPSGGRVLDLCTGTADLLIEALDRDPQRRGTGIDLSGEMLIRGRRKLEGRGLSPRAALLEGDAERLPFCDRSFRAALVAFGIRNVGDVPAAIGEVRRVLEPGGHFVILEFSMPGGPLGGLYRLYFGRVLPRIGALISGDPGAYSYLPASVGRFLSPRGLASLLEECGFCDVVQRPLTGGIARLYRATRAA
jgi:demethylmenaquinone methyltransferase / 2-methoxy-6-polyprenyl-1,4-benzoquinol methylase